MTFKQFLNEVKVKLEPFDPTKNWKKNSDGSYDVDGDVNLSRQKLTEIPWKFNVVKGFFYCSGNLLTSLKGAPKEVGGYFTCSDNDLTSLEGAPKEVGRHFYCNNNKLTSLEGAPKEVGWDFICNNNSKKFTEEDVKKLCNVKGKIYV